MKKIEQPLSLSKTYLPVILYLDDLEEIVEILQQHSDRIEISTDQYEFDSLEELKQEYPKMLPALEIKTSSPYASITFSQTRTSQYISSSELKNSEIFLRIDRIISKRLRIITKFTTKLIYPLTGVVGLLFITSSARLLPQTNKISLMVIVYMAVYFSVVIIDMFFSLRNHSRINMMYRIEAENFFSRNRDRLILMVISAILGSFLGVVVTYYFKK